MGITSAASVVISILFFFIWGSPIELFLNAKIENIKDNYALLDNNLVNLQHELHSSIFPGDRFYRELLELDSLSTSERIAGIGGAEPDIQLESYPNNLIVASTNKNLQKLKSQLELQENSFNNIHKEALIYNNELTGIPAIQPVKPSDNMWISSYFGYRNDPFLKLKKRHKGIDFVAPKNTEIYATADGEIKITKESHRGYGKEIIISHKFGYSSRYAHLNKILVKEGDKVKRGQLIGLMGNTGRSTGTHLHYEVRLNKRQINPYYFFADDLTEHEYDLITASSNNE